MCFSLLSEKNICVGRGLYLFWGILTFMERRYLLSCLMCCSFVRSVRLLLVLQKKFSTWLMCRHGCYSSSKTHTQTPSSWCIQRSCWGQINLWPFCVVHLGPCLSQSIPHKDISPSHPPTPLKILFLHSCHSLHIGLLSWWFLWNLWVNTTKSGQGLQGPLDFGIWPALLLLQCTGLNVGVQSVL